MNKFWIFLIIWTFLLTSCMKVDTELYIDDDFSMSWKSTIDYTKINSLSKQFTNMEIIKDFAWQELF